MACHNTANKPFPECQLNSQLSSVNIENIKFGTKATGRYVIQDTIPWYSNIYSCCYYSSNVIHDLEKIYAVTTMFGSVALMTLEAKLSQMQPKRVGAKIYARWKFEESLDAYLLSIFVTLA